MRRSRDARSWPCRDASRNHLAAAEVDGATLGFGAVAQPDDEQALGLETLRIDPPAPPRGGDPKRLEALAEIPAGAGYLDADRVADACLTDALHGRVMAVVARQITVRVLYGAGLLISIVGGLLSAA